MIATLKTDRLREYIIRHNMSQADFARAVGVTGSHLAMLLNGTRNPTAGVRQRLLAAIKKQEGGAPEFDDYFAITRQKQ